MDETATALETGSSSSTPFSPSPSDGGSGHCDKCGVALQSKQKERGERGRPGSLVRREERRTARVRPRVGIERRALDGVIAITGKEKRRREGEDEDESYECVIGANDRPSPYHLFSYITRWGALRGVAWRDAEKRV